MCSFRDFKLKADNKVKVVLAEKYFTYYSCPVRHPPTMRKKNN